MWVGERYKINLRGLFLFVCHFFHIKKKDMERLRCFIQVEMPRVQAGYMILEVKRQIWNTVVDNSCRR